MQALATSHSAPLTEILEPWFEMPALAMPLPESLSNAWATQSIDPTLRLPPVNPYVPTDFSLRASAEARAEGEAAAREALAAQLGLPVVLSMPPTMLLDKPGAVWVGVGAGDGGALRPTDIGQRSSPLAPSLLVVRYAVLHLHCLRSQATCFCITSPPFPLPLPFLSACPLASLQSCTCVSQAVASSPSPSSFRSAPVAQAGRDLPHAQGCGSVPAVLPRHEPRPTHLGSWPHAAQGNTVCLSVRREYEARSDVPTGVHRCWYVQMDINFHPKRTGWHTCSPFCATVSLQLLEDVLNEDAYLADVAGLHYHLSLEGLAGIEVRGGAQGCGKGRGEEERMLGEEVVECRQRRKVGQCA